MHRTRLILAWLACALVACSQPSAAPAPVDAGPHPSLGSPWQRPPRAATPPKPKLAAARPPILPASWTVPAWFIDPALGSDKNACTTSGLPCKTWGELVGRWGTDEPRIRQDTTITFLSSQADNSDPIHWQPYVENGAHLTITGPLGSGQLIASGKIHAVTAKNRGTGQQLLVTFGDANGNTGGTAQANITTSMLAVNTQGGKASRAWTFAAGGLDQFTMTQPETSAPAEVDTWAANDTYSVYQPVAVDVAVLLPNVVDYNAPTFDNQLLVSQIAVLDPSGVEDDDLILNDTVKLLDVWLQRGGAAAFRTQAVTSFFINVLNAGYFYGLGSPIGASFFMYAGAVAGFGENACQGCGLFDDVYLTASMAVTGSLDAVYISTGVLLEMGPSFCDIGIGLNNVIWGPGTLNVIGPARCLYPSGAAVATFKQTGFTLNGLTTACSASGATTQTITCGISLTPAHLDAAAGASGFGGQAFSLSGASLFGGASNNY